MEFLWRMDWNQTLENIVRDEPVFGCDFKTETYIRTFI